MRKAYQVTIQIDDPYPKDFTFRIEAISTGRACYIAYNELRKKRKGKREPERVTYKTVKLGWSEPTGNED